MTPTIKERLGRHNWDIRNTAVLSPDLIYSQAFADLSASSLRVLVRLLQKRKFYKAGKKARGGRRIIYDDSPLILTYLEAECLGLSKSTFGRAIKQLCRVGFIAIEHQGGSIGTGKDWSTYRLINDWQDYGSDRFRPREKEAQPLRTSRSIEKYNAAGRPKHQKREYSIAIPDTLTVSEMTPWKPEALVKGYSEVTLGNLSLINHETAYRDNSQPLLPHLNLSPLRVPGMTLFI